MRGADGRPTGLLRESAEGAPGAEVAGSFRTAPSPEAEDEVTFTVVTGMMYGDLDDREGFSYNFV